MLQSLRHNFPLLYTLIRIFIFGSIIACAFYLVFALATSMSPKLSALGSAMHWSAKAFIFDGHKSTNVKPAKHFTAEILGMTKGAKVVFKMVNADGYHRVEAEFADLVITDIVNTTLLVNRFKGRSIFVDYYQYVEDEIVHDCVVLWDEFSSPINLELVQRRFAEPVQTPPTNIVNTLMASHYWRKFKE